jgi:hypothetical protein
MDCKLIVSYNSIMQAPAKKIMALFSEAATPRAPDCHPAPKITVEYHIMELPTVLLFDALPIARSN